jgi:hypothetical protein
MRIYSERQPFTRSDIIVLLSVFLVIEGYAFYHSFHHPETIYTGDSIEYKMAAQNLLDHHTLYAGKLGKEINPALYSRRPPGYPIFIVISKIISNSDFLIIFLQFLLNLISLLIFIKILSLKETGRTSAFLLMLIFIIYPAQRIYTHFIMAEILLQTLLLSGLFFIIKFFRSKRLSDLFAYNIILAISVLVKPVMLYFWIVNLFFHLGLLKFFRRRIILLFPLIILAVITVWSLRNCLITDYYHFSSIKSFNLLYYNVNSFLSNHYGVDYARKLIEEIDSVTQQMSLAERTEYVEQRSYEILSKHWISYSVYHLRGMAFFFFDPGRFDLYQYWGMNNRKGFFNYISQYGVAGIPLLLHEIPTNILIMLFFIFILNMLLLFGSIGYLIFVPNERNLKLFIGIIVGYFALLTGPLGASRFRLPIFPYLLLSSIWGFEYFRKHYFKKQHTE